MSAKLPQALERLRSADELEIAALRGDLKPFCPCKETLRWFILLASRFGTETVMANIELGCCYAGCEEPLPPPAKTVPGGYTPPPAKQEDPKLPPPPPPPPELVCDTTMPLPATWDGSNRGY